MINYRDHVGREVFHLYERDPLCEYVPPLERIKQPRDMKGAMFFRIRRDVLEWLHNQDPAGGEYYVTSFVEERFGGAGGKIEYLPVARVIVFKTPSLATIFKLTWCNNEAQHG